MWLLVIICAVVVICKIISETSKKPIPAKNWANEDLEYEDIMNGVPMEEIIERARDGRYKHEK